MTRVWVTRSAPAGERLATALRDAGIRAEWVSALRIEALSAPRILSLKTPGVSGDSGLEVDLGIVVSQHAARLYRQSDYFDPKRKHLAIGTATARALGFDAEIASRSDTAGVLAHPALDDQSQSTLLIAGEGGRQDLLDALRGRPGASCKLELYRRVPADLAALRPGEGDMMEVSSLYALRAIKAEWARLQRQAAGVHLIVPSHRIAEEAGALGFERVYVASSATVQDMVAGVFEWQEQ